MFCFGLISLLNPSSSEPEFGRIRSARPEFFFSSYFSFKHNSRIVFFSFFSGFWFFSAVIYTAVVITLTTHNLQTVRPGNVLGPEPFRLGPIHRIHLGSSSRESTRGSMVAAGPRSGCFNRFIVFFKACLLLQNQTRTTSLS